MIIPYDTIFLLYHTIWYHIFIISYHQNNYENPNDLIDRAILSATNKNSEIHNEEVLKKLKTEEKTYYSADEPTN